MKANGRLAYLHSSSIKQEPSVSLCDHDQGCTPIPARTIHTSRKATRKPAMSSTEFCDNLAIVVRPRGKCCGLARSITQIGRHASSVLGHDVAPLRNASVTGLDGPLPVSGMSSNTDTNPA